MSTADANRPWAATSSDPNHQSTARPYLPPVPCSAKSRHLRTPRPKKYRAERDRNPSTANQQPTLRPTDGRIVPKLTANLMPAPSHSHFLINARIPKVYGYSRSPGPPTNTPTQWAVSCICQIPEVHGQAVLTKGSQGSYIGIRDTNKLAASNTERK